MLSEVVFGEVVLGGLANAQDEDASTIDYEKKSVGSTASLPDDHFSQGNSQISVFFGVRVSQWILSQQHSGSENHVAPLANGPGAPSRS